MTSVAIINWNSGPLLRTCIESLLATTANAEILVVDNASEDASLDSAQAFHNRVTLIRNSANRGFAAAVNQAFRATSTSYVLILNPDVRVLPGAVQMLQEFLRAHPRFAPETAATAGGRVPWARLTDAAGAMRTWPQRDGADGFFAVRLRLAPG